MALANHLRALVTHKLAKPVWLLALLSPLAVLVAGGPEMWGANPIEYINRWLGDWALRFLILTLALSPVARITKVGALVRLRRMTGLTAFFYAVLHVTNYLAIDYFFDWSSIWSDILKRRYITIGMLTLLLLTPLAVTSTKKMIRRLGARRWQRLHRVVYVAAALAVIHYTLMTKADYMVPAIHGTILAILLLARLPALTRLLGRSKRDLSAHSSADAL